MKLRFLTGLCAAVGLLTLSAAGASGGGKSFTQACSDGSRDGGEPMARCFADILNSSGGAVQAAITPSGLGPVQFHTAYSLPLNAGSVQTIAIVDAFDDPKIESDLGVYSTQYGLPACTSGNGCFKKVNQNGIQGSYPVKNAGWALEIALDVEIAHAICQNCKILLVEAKTNSFTNLLKAEDRAFTMGADVISNSWGANEFSGETAFDFHFDHSGVPITVSSGDNGFAGGVEYPAASRFVTAVGGTTLNLNGNDTRATETVWSGAGSGCSAFEAKPGWQVDACLRRTVADVSAVADPNTGAAVYDTVRISGQKGWFVIGGTSLSSPLVAGVYALAGNAASTVYGSFPYSSSGSLFDVVSGSNGGCSPSYLCTGVASYDGPTGVGAVNGTGGF